MIINVLVLKMPPTHHLLLSDWAQTTVPRHSQPYTRTKFSPVCKTKAISISNSNYTNKTIGLYTHKLSPEPVNMFLIPPLGLRCVFFGELS